MAFVLLIWTLQLTLFVHVCLIWSAFDSLVCGQENAELAWLRIVILIRAYKSTAAEHALKDGFRRFQTPGEVVAGFRERFDLAVGFAARRWGSNLTDSKSVLESLKSPIGPSVAFGLARQRGGWAWSASPNGERLAGSNPGSASAKAALAQKNADKTGSGSALQPRCTIPRVHFSEMSVERFRRDFAGRNLPVILVGAAAPQNRPTSGLQRAHNAWCGDAMGHLMLYVFFPVQSLADFRVEFAAEKVTKELVGGAW